MLRAQHKARAPTNDGHLYRLSLEAKFSRKQVCAMQSDDRLQKIKAKVREEHKLLSNAT